MTTYVRVSRRPGAQFFRFSAIGGVFAYRGVMTYYGTVMTAKLTVSFDEFEQAMSDRPNPPGFVRGSVMKADDGVTVVGAFIFESKEAYLALADNPDQAQWYGEVVAPMLDGEAAWIDGHWKDNE
ncbi:MAG: hypothetical protein CL523_01085 [Actinomycetales bacterium]|nr:MAG: hypothetical protein CL523_01085 [Actinomycetales bacterium]